LRTPPRAKSLTAFTDLSLRAVHANAENAATLFKLYTDRRDSLGTPLPRLVYAVDSAPGPSDCASVFHHGHARYARLLHRDSLASNVWGRGRIHHRGARPAGDHFRGTEPPTANPDKYRDELLDAYLFVKDADALYAEYAGQGVEFTRGLANMPWHSREFGGEGLRWPSAGFRREPIVFSLVLSRSPALQVGYMESLHLVFAAAAFRPLYGSPKTLPETVLRLEFVSCAVQSTKL
jgi:hypothetical protein